MRSREQQSILILAGLAAVAACWPAASAQAVYTNLSVERHAAVTIGGIDRWVYRVYANFTDPNDRFIEVYGTSTAQTTIESRNATDTGPGSNFFNTPGGTTAPQQIIIDGNPNAQWDTFVTIGVSVADQGDPYDQTSLLPGFMPLSGNSYTITNGAWYVAPTIDHDGDPGTPEILPLQTLAGFAGDGDFQNRVMVLQLTVNAGDNVRGSLNLITFQPYPGGSNPFHEAQAFNSVPGAGTLGALGLAMIVGGKRRRKG